MRVLILGGTGAVGILFIRECLSRSYTVVVFARSPDKLPDDVRESERVTIIKGTFEEDAELSSAIKGADAVISALGPSTSLTKFHPRDQPLAKAYAKVIYYMEEHNVNRLIGLGTPTMADENDKFDLFWTGVVAGIRLSSPNIYKDVVAIGETIRAAPPSIDWTIARVPFLLDGDAKEVITGYVGDGKLGRYLNRAGYADFVVGELSRSDWVQKAPLIATP